MAPGSIKASGGLFFAQLKNTPVNFIKSFWQTGCVRNFCLHQFRPQFASFEPPIYISTAIALQQELILKIAVYENIPATAWLLLCCCF